MDQPKYILTSDQPMLNVTRIEEVRQDPPVRGEALLKPFEWLVLRLTRFVGYALPEDLNPLAQLGAVANITFTIALISGILLLFWYKPSVNFAYDSLEMMKQSPFLAELMRSLHRYSSDACMLFVVLHTLQIFFARKFNGARWLAWVSGVFLIWLLWFDGWTGYWLVWDERAQKVALGTAKWLDGLPIFADPLSLSFLTDEHVNSLFFFIIFFIHMLIPLAMAIGLWIHIMRLNKTRFFTTRLLTIFITISLIAVSLLYPVESAQKANMQVIPQQFSIDWYYLFPLIVTDRLQGGALWALSLILTIIFGGVPWLFTRRLPTPTRVLEARCNGCKQCYEDCPFNAITIMPGQGKHPLVAKIDPNTCVACGVCVGSCEPWAIEYPGLNPKDVRHWIMQSASPEADKRFVAFVCAESAGAGLKISPDGECAELPGYRVVPIPCVSWLFAPMIGQLLKRGVPGVLIVACGPNPSCRKGVQWMRERLTGERDPALNSSAIDLQKIRFVRLDRSAQATFIEYARAFREGNAAFFPFSSEIQKNQQVPIGINQLRRLVIIGSVGLGLAGLTWFLSDAAYRPPQMEHAEMVISFKHPGHLVEKVNQTAENQDNVLPHMRKPAATVTERYRAPVRMQVFIDGTERVNRVYPPGGLFEDGASIAIETIPLDLGSHHVRVMIGDTENVEEWPFVDEQDLTFEPAKRRVMLFDKTAGFKWY